MDLAPIIDILRALPVPMGVAIVIMLAFHWRRGPAEGGEIVRKTSSLAAGVAIAAGVLAGYWNTKIGSWSFPPRQSVEWIWPTMIVGGVAAVALAFIKGTSARLAVRVVAVALVTAGVTWKLARTQWPIGMSVAWIGGMMLILTLAWALVDHMASHRGERGTSVLPSEANGRASTFVTTSTTAPAAWSSPLALMMWAGMASQALAATGSMQLGKFAAILSALLGVVFIFSIFRPAVDVSGGGVGATILLMGLLIFGGHHYSSMEAVWMVALLVIAPIFAAAVDLLVLRRFGRMPRSIGRVAAISLLPMIVLAVAVPAAIKAAEEMNQYGY
jgi:hypothetical protein